MHFAIMGENCQMHFAIPSESYNALARLCNSLKHEKQ